MTSPYLVSHSFPSSSDNQIETIADDTTMSTKSGPSLRKRLFSRPGSRAGTADKSVTPPAAFEGDALKQALERHQQRATETSASAANQEGLYLTRTLTNTAKPLTRSNSRGRLLRSFTQPEQPDIAVDTSFKTIPSLPSPSSPSPPPSAMATRFAKTLFKTSSRPKSAGGARAEEERAASEQRRLKASKSRPRSFLATSIASESTQKLVTEPLPASDPVAAPSPISPSASAGGWTNDTMSALGMDGSEPVAWYDATGPEAANASASTEQHQRSATEQHSSVTNLRAPHQLIPSRSMPHLIPSIPAISSETAQSVLESAAIPNRRDSLPVGFDPYRGSAGAFAYSTPEEEFALSSPRRPTSSRAPSLAPSRRERGRARALEKIKAAAGGAEAPAIPTRASSTVHVAEVSEEIKPSLLVSPSEEDADEVSSAGSGQFTALHTPASTMSSAFSSIVGDALFSSKVDIPGSTSTTASSPRRSSPSSSPVSPSALWSPASSDWSEQMWTQSQEMGMTLPRAGVGLGAERSIRRIPPSPSTIIEDEAMVSTPSTLPSSPPLISLSFSPSPSLGGFNPFPSPSATSLSSFASAQPSPLLPSSSSNASISSRRRPAPSASNTLPRDKSSTWLSMLARPGTAQSTLPPVAPLAEHDAKWFLHPATNFDEIKRLRTSHARVECYKRKIQELKEAESGLGIWMEKMKAVHDKDTPRVSSKAAKVLGMTYAPGKRREVEGAGAWGGSSAPASPTIISSRERAAATTTTTVRKEKRVKAPVKRKPVEIVVFEDAPVTPHPTPVRSSTSPDFATLLAGTSFGTPNLSLDLQSPVDPFGSGRTMRTLTVAPRPKLTPKSNRRPQARPIGGVSKSMVGEPVSVS